MESLLRVTTQVLPGSRIEFAAPGLAEGSQVEIVVLPLSPPTSPKSGIDIIRSLAGHRLFQTPAEVDRYLQQERDSWEH
jgi:hypothetical protein